MGKDKPGPTDEEIERVYTEELTKGLIKAKDPKQSLKNATDNLGLPLDATNDQIGAAMVERGKTKT